MSHLTPHCIVEHSSGLFILFQTGEGGAEVSAEISAAFFEGHSKQRANSAFFFLFSNDYYVETWIKTKERKDKQRSEEAWDGFSFPKRSRINLKCDSRFLLRPRVISENVFSPWGKNRLNEKSPAARPLSVGRLENNSAGSEAPSRPSSPRTAGLQRLATRDEWREERLSEGCNSWLTGDRYLPLRSTASSRGPACWGGSSQWDKEEPSDLPACWIRKKPNKKIINIC